MTPDQRLEAVLAELAELDITDKQKKWLCYALTGGTMPDIVGRMLKPKGLVFKVGNDRAWSLTSAGQKLAEEIKASR